MLILILEQSNPRLRLEVKSQKSKVKKIKAHLSQASKFIYGRRKKYPIGKHRSGVEQLGRPCFKPPDLSVGFLFLTFNF
jgi:hypothetical protein